LCASCFAEELEDEKLLTTTSTRNDHQSRIAATALRHAINGDFEASLPAYRKNVELNPSDAESRIDLAVILRAVGHMDEARQEFSRAIELEPNNARSHNELGLFLTEIGDLKGGLSELHRATMLDPQDVKYLHDLAVAMAITGKREEAERNLKKCIELDPTFCDAYTDIGLICLNSGRPSLAIQNLTASLELKEARRPRLGRAVAFTKVEKYDLAIDDCSRVLRHSINDREALAYRAYAYMRCGNHTLAIDDAKHAMQGGDEYSDLAYLVLGVVDLESGNLDSADANLTKSIRIESDQPVPLVFRAIARLRRGMVKEAVADLDASVESVDDARQLNAYLDGCGWQIYKFRGILKLFCLNDSRGAVVDLTSAIAINDRDADCYAIRSWAFSSLSDWKHALADLESAQQIDPTHEYSNLLLVNLLTSCPDSSLRDGHRAMAVAKAVCAKTEWKSAVCIAYLAAAYSEDNQFENAATLQERAIDRIRHQDERFSSDMRVWWNWKVRIALSLDQDKSKSVLEMYRLQKPFRVLPNLTSTTVSNATPD
jgi:tetratricopeptide (TPR) repeat protein